MFTQILNGREEFLTFLWIIHETLVVEETSCVRASHLRKNFAQLFIFIFKKPVEKYFPIRIADRAHGDLRKD